MADISSISGASEGSFRASAAERVATSTTDLARVETARRQREADSVSLSDAARSAARSESLGDVRTDLTSRIRAELEAGTYVTEAKLDAAVEKLIDDILS